MTIQETEWSLSTCGCVVKYTWDDTQSEDTRTYTLSSYVKKCTAHSTLATDADRWNCVWAGPNAENPRLSGTIAALLDNGPSTLFDVAEEGGRRFKKNISLSFSWTGTPPNRVFNVSVIGITLTTQQKTTIQGFIDTKFGAGKIVLT